MTDPWAWATESHALAETFVYTAPQVRQASYYTTRPPGRPELLHTHIYTHHHHTYLFLRFLRGIHSLILASPGHI